MVVDVSSSLELIKVSSDEGKMEPKEEKGDQVPQEPLEEDLEDHKSDTDDEDAKMSDAGNNLSYFGLGLFLVILCRTAGVV